MPLCPQCSHENAPSAKFCNECGNTLARACISCGHINESKAKFCAECGIALQKSSASTSSPPISQPQPPSFTAPPQPSLSGERRRVTVLFADLSGSTALGEKFDAEEVYNVMNGCFAGLTGIIERHGGYVVKYIGDCIMALFGAPVAHGDDPQLALRAALEMQNWLGDFSRDLEQRKGVPFRMRIGLNFGHVVAGGIGGDGAKTYDVLGDTVNVAQRLESIAEPGAVFISEALRRLTARDFEFSSEGRISVKGRAEAVEVFRVRGPRVRQADVLSDGPIIGRDAELQQIRAAVAHLASSDNVPFSAASQLLVFSGEAGIGKTRLMEAAIQQAAEHAVSVHFSSCVEREAARPFGLVRQILNSLFGLEKELSPSEKAAHFSATVRQLFEFPETISPNIIPWLPVLQNLLGADMEVAPLALDEEARKNLVMQGLREIFEALCHETPRLLLIDDAQWLDELSTAALGVLASEVATQGTLLIIVAHWPGWNHTWPEESCPRILNLQGLGVNKCRQLIESLIGASALPDSIIETIVSRSGGNPYYLREVLQELIEAGHLRRENNIWHSNDTLGDFVVPDTIYHALVARLDRLDAPSREVLQCGAVIGLEFVVRQLSALLSPIAHNQSSPFLRRLESLEFLVEAEPPPDWAFRFRHAAMREVAYDALLLASRKTMHTKVAAWLEEKFTGRENEVAAQLAHHHEKAENFRRAANYWVQAGHEARALFANADALRFFQQAISLLDDSAENQPITLEAYKGCGAVQKRIGHFQEAIEAWQQALALLENADISSSQKAMQHASTLRELALCQSETGLSKEAQQNLRKAFRALRGHSGHATDRERSLVIGDRAFGLYRQGYLRHANRLGLWSYSLAERAASERERGEAANLLGLISQAQGNTEVALNYYEQAQEASDNCGNLSGAASALNNIGNLHFHAGHFAQAEEAWQNALQSWEKIGDSVQLAWTLNNLGNLHLARGDFVQALENFQGARTRFHRAGQRFGEAATLAVSGEAHLENGDFALAIEALRAAKNLAAELNALDLQAYIQTTLATALLENGEGAKAYQEAQEALALSRTIVNSQFEGIALRTLGRLSLREQNYQAAETHLNTAFSLFDEHHLRPEQGRTLLALTEFYRVTNRDAEAEKYRLQALQIFQEIGAMADAARAQRA